MSALPRFVGRRIDLFVAVISGDIGNRRDHVFLVCDGTGDKPVYAILPRYHVTDRNKALINVKYGEMTGLSGVLVRYNPARDSFNLLVTRGAGVSLQGLCLNAEAPGTGSSPSGDPRPSDLP